MAHDDESLNRIERALLEGYRSRVDVSHDPNMTQQVMRDIRRIGSAALDLSAIAAGRLDAFYERGLNPWDHAAGALIVREAGGRGGGVGGGPESGELLIAAAPSVYDELDALLAEAGAASG